MKCSNDGCEETDVEKGRTICKKCKRAQMAARAAVRREADREEYNRKMKEFRASHPMSEEQKLKEAERQAIKYVKYKGKIDARNSEWRKNNKGKMRAYRAKRRAAQLQATPKWLTPEQLQQMQDIYIQAAEMTRKTGIEYEVDHIIPLQGENVSGLHVPWNLQILQKCGPGGNRSKQNKV